MIQIERYCRLLLHVKRLKKKTKLLLKPLPKAKLMLVMTQKNQLTKASLLLSTVPVILLAQY